jgi:quercetin dioxygenase-like cupin family protein
MHHPLLLDALWPLGGGSMRKRAGETVFLTAGEGTGTTSGPRQIKIKIAGESTSGRYAMVEDTMPPHYSGQTLHVHRSTDEAFYVANGALRFQLGDEKRDAPAGTFVFIPRGTVHALMNPTAEPVTCLILLSPPGFEKYFEELARVVNANPTPETLLAIGSKYDREVVGPPMTP